MQERRTFPRYAVDWPVTLQRQGVSPFRGSACDVSGAGMALKASRAAVLALAQGGSVLMPGDRLELEVAAGGAMDPALAVGGRVRNVRRLSREEYQVAVRFEDLDPVQERVLDTLLEQARACQPRP